MNKIKNYRTAARPGQLMSWPLARLVLGAAVMTNLLALPLAGQAAAYFYTDLNPSGFTESDGAGTSVGPQVGVGYGSAAGDFRHALLWSGTASRVVDLNPSGFLASRALSVSGGQQVGVGKPARVVSSGHALLWSG